MQPKDALLIAFYLGGAAGFIAGKTDLDIKIKNAIQRQQIRVATQSANILADTLEKRKLGIASS